MAGFCILLTRAGADVIRESMSWGYVTIGMSDAEPTGVVLAISNGNGSRRPVTVDNTHYLSVADSRPNCVWHRVPVEVNASWILTIAQQTMIDFEEFATRVSSGLRQPGHAAYYAITHVVDDRDRYPGFPVPEFAAWYVSRDGVRSVDIDVESERSGAALLEPHWPVGDLAGARVLLVGAGSIGGAAALALASAGVGTLDLLDPDRLRWHNLPRHVCGPKHVGRLKVEALRVDLGAVRPEIAIHAHERDVVADADEVRQLLTRVDLVLCATDGVSSRRVVSHLARRADRPAVLACVLADGAYGDILRLWPWPHHGCLMCRTEALTDSGGMLPDLETATGYGGADNPMTAVGIDLHLVGQFAAKIAVATLLHSRGHHDQWTAGEHAVIALRPRPGWAAPYDLRRAGEVAWRHAPTPRTGCPTCGGVDRPES